MTFTLQSRFGPYGYSWFSPSIRIFPEFRACFSIGRVHVFSVGRVHVSFRWSRACFFFGGRVQVSLQWPCACFPPLAACMFLFRGRVQVSFPWPRASFFSVAACKFLFRGRVHVLSGSRVHVFSVGRVHVSVRWLRDSVFLLAACGVLVWCALLLWELDFAKELGYQRFNLTSLSSFANKSLIFYDVGTGPSLASQKM